MECPCKGCTKRWVTETSRCHATCKEYKEWSDFKNRERDLTAKRKAEMNSTAHVLFGHRRKK